MEVKKQNASTDEMATAEVELLAAQEALRDARLRLEKLQAQHPALKPCLADDKDTETAQINCEHDEGGVASSEKETRAKSVCSKDRSSKLGSESMASEADRADHKAAPISEKRVSFTDKCEKKDSCAQAPLPSWVPYRVPSENVGPDLSSPAEGVGNFSVEPPRGFVSTAQPAPSKKQSLHENSSAGVSASSSWQARQAEPKYHGATGGQPPCVKDVSGGSAQDVSSMPHVGPGSTPPRQPYYGYQQSYYQQGAYGHQSGVSAKDHVVAGLLAIFLGFLGMHKFYLGYNVAGFVMLGVTVLGGLLTFSLASWVVWIIGIIEGILYLTKSQSEFEQSYVINKREWF